MRKMPVKNLLLPSLNTLKIITLIFPIGEVHQIENHIYHMSSKHFSSEIFRRLEKASDAKLERTETVL